MPPAISARRLPIPSSSGSHPASASSPTSPSARRIGSRSCCAARPSPATWRKMAAATRRRRSMATPGKAKPMAGKRRGLKVDGWVVLDKPVGMTSTQAVGAVRRVFQAAKAGHGGTLDPLATGLLPIALGEATKTVAYVMAGLKIYRFTLRFGEARATDDAEGEVTATCERRPSDEEIRHALIGVR